MTLVLQIVETLRGARTIICPSTHMNSIRKRRHSHRRGIKKIRSHAFSPRDALMKSLYRRLQICLVSLWALCTPWPRTFKFGRHAMFPVAPEFSSRRVLNRFLLRILILVLFATLGVFRSKGFGPTFVSLLVLAAGFCIGLAMLHREAVFGRVLTNWDEAAAFLLIGCTVTWLA